MEASARFEFSDQGKAVVIAGHDFTITTGDVDGINAALELQGRLEKIDLKTIEPGVYMTFCHELMSVIDGIIGPGACERIFAGRRINIIHLVELLRFALEQATDGFDSAIKGVVNDLVDIVPE